MGTIVCSECGRETDKHVGKICYRCYKRRYTPPFVTCKECGEVRPHHARGLCLRCYQKLHVRDKVRAWQVKKNYNINYSLWKKITEKCFICGWDKCTCELHHLDGDESNNSPENLVGLCPNHHRMIVDPKYAVELRNIIRNKRRTSGEHH